MKYAIALRLGTAEAEQVLHRVTRDGPQDLNYLATKELARAVPPLSWTHVHPSGRVELHANSLPGAQGVLGPRTSDQSVTGRHSASRATMSRQARCACRGW
ncbi:hypothetical protein BCL80_104505 [Streptomyces avidinii]|uniref:hypothetical protein n=1 Tax=[Kitasatospora] papulosa TaxID=1464011 RepID=UPI0004CBBAF2|nr:hypothetical protein BCL80_104505 [Streptomyces avidinii]SNX76377.1 hypothetical protein SAMN05421860_102559 [Streptomyces microflavus]